MGEGDRPWAFKGHYNSKLLEAWSGLPLVRRSSSPTLDAHNLLTQEGGLWAVPLFPILRLEEEGWSLQMLVLLGSGSKMISPI